MKDITIFHLELLKRTLRKHFPGQIYFLQNMKMAQLGCLLRCLLDLKMVSSKSFFMTLYVENSGDFHLFFHQYKPFSMSIGMRILQYYGYRS